MTHPTNVDEERFARMVTTGRVGGKARADRLVLDMAAATAKLKAQPAIC